MTREQLVEVMARAICLDLGDNPDELCVLIAGREGTRPAWEGFVSTATAALAAIETAGIVVVPVGLLEGIRESRAGHDWSERGYWYADEQTDKKISDLIQAARKQ
jgi:hypothetical protein